MILLDTNILIAILLEKDSQHTRAIEAIKEIHEEVSIPSCVLVETSLVLQHLTKDEKFVSESISQLNENFSIIPETGEIIFNGVKRFHEKFRKLSLVDCLILETKISLSFKVLTFDEELSRELEKLDEKTI